MCPQWRRQGVGVGRRLPLCLLLLCLPERGHAAPPRAMQLVPLQRAPVQVVYFRRDYLVVVLLQFRHEGVLLHALFHHLWKPRTLHHVRHLCALPQPLPLLDELLHLYVKFLVVGVLAALAVQERRHGVLALDERLALKRLLLLDLLVDHGSRAHQPVVDLRLCVAHLAQGLVQHLQVPLELVLELQKLGRQLALGPLHPAVLLVLQPLLGKLCADDGDGQR
mmetsp:Transcript_30978/g.77575  ORF Transcript_30978/g.77575 Transcript_30978/m.77575 type:complete len:222 (-) Transcript_30978:1740-2405(-)